VTTQSYPAVTSEPTETDVPNAAILDASGLAPLTDGFPALSDMRAAETVALSYTTAPLAQGFLSAGPADLDIRLSSTAPTSTIWAVISDVGPDGTPHPLDVGRLSTDYPNVDPAKSLEDPATGAIVQPYGDFSVKTPATPTESRLYHVEFWPLGNQFRAGDRIRLDLVGQSLASLPTVPGLNTVTLGGTDPSRLLIPVIPATP
jgi:hypothetical protein